MSNPYWPKTLIFIGAGSTAQLGSPATAKQGAMFRILGKDEDGKSLSERVSEAFYSPQHNQAITDLLCCLGDSLESNLYDFSKEEKEAAYRLFPDLNEKKRLDLIRQLREIYDWDALKKIIKIVPGFNCDDCNDAVFLLDLFNIVDFHIKDVHGFYASLTDEDSSLSHQYKYFIPPQRLHDARTCMLMLVNLFFFCKYQDMLSDKEKREKFNEYSKFVEALTQVMQKEAVEKYNKDIATSRDYYLFPYSIISLNYDPIWLWLYFVNQKKANENSRYVGAPAKPIKLFNDFGTFMGIREICHTDSVFPRYPFNESVVQRINDPNHISDRVVRLGKFYFPHCCCCIRECRNCGKMIMALGESFDLFSESVLPNPIIPAFQKSKARSDREKKAFEEGRPDAIECPFCGNLTYASDNPLIMQTSFKGNHPPFIEEIQREAKVSLENADHIVMLGYSIPQDDIVWRTIISTRKARLHKSGNKKLLCSIITGYGGPNRWIAEKEEIQALIDECKNDEDKSTKYSIETVKQAISIFGIDNIRIYIGGIPDFWSNYKGSLEERAKDMINPKWK